MIKYKYQSLKIKELALIVRKVKRLTNQRAFNYANISLDNNLSETDLMINRSVDLAFYNRFRTEMSSKSFEQFKYSVADEQSPMSSPSPFAYRQPASNRDQLTKKRIILSDDEDDRPYKSKHTDIIIKKNKLKPKQDNDDGGWVKRRDPEKISDKQLQRNIEKAKIERKQMKASTSKSTTKRNANMKSPLLSNILNLKDDDGDLFDDSSSEDEAVNRGGKLSRIVKTREETYKNERNIRLLQRQCKSNTHHYNIFYIILNLASLMHDA